MFLVPYSYSNAEIQQTRRPKGRFDVLFDDGTTEIDVLRCRVQLDPKHWKPETELFGSGEDSQSNTLMTLSNLSRASFSMQDARENSFSTSVRKRRKSIALKKDKSLSMMNQKFRESSVPKHTMPMQTGSSVITFDSTDNIEDSPSKNSVTSHGTWWGSNTFFEEEDENGMREYSDPRVTVIPGMEWKLVYVGNDNRYACTGLVPRAVLETEPHLRVGVMFAIQTHGLDWPQYERSQLSKPAIFYTTAEEEDFPPIVAVTHAQPINLDSNISSGENKEDDIFESNAMSKTKKEIFTAVIKGQQMVKIERRSHYYYAEGAGEDYV